MNHHPSDQLGFDALLTEAQKANEARIFARATAHLPGTMHVAKPFYARLIEAHHAAMLVGDVDETLRLREEARLLATKLNKGEPGILAHDEAPGYVLERTSAAEAGTTPLWGQTGAFVLELSGMRVRFEMEGILGIGVAFSFWPGFSVHAVDLDKPFLSQTGYRSFLGIHAEPIPDLTPRSFCERVISAHITRELKARLVSIAPEYRGRLRGEG